jgi:hypothetical protein
LRVQCQIKAGQIQSNIITNNCVACPRKIAAVAVERRVPCGSGSSIVSLTLGLGALSPVTFSPSPSSLPCTLTRRCPRHLWPLRHITFLHIVRSFTSRLLHLSRHGLSQAQGLLPKQLAFNHKPIDPTVPWFRPSERAGRVRSVTQIC